MKSQTSYTCPICNQTSVQPVLYKRLIRNPWSVAPYIFLVTYCPNCHYAYNPLMTKQVYTALNQHYLQFTPAMTLEQMKDSGIYKQGLMQRDFIHSHLPNHLSRPKQLLDIGCGEGVFLHIMNEAGYHAAGIEPSPKQAHIAKQRTPHPVEVAFFEAPHIYYKNLFDIITLRHVLEHVFQPAVILQKIASSLTDQGVLYIEVPDSEHPKVMVPPFFVPEHISYFTIQSLSYLLNQWGFGIMQWESFKDNPNGSMNYPVLRVLAKKNSENLVDIQTSAWNGNLTAAFENYFQDRQVLLKSLTHHLRAHHFYRGFWMFGAGYHSEILLEDLPEWQPKVIGFLDNNPEKDGRMFLGKPVHRPDILLNHPVRNVLLSSISEKEILQGMEQQAWFNQTHVLGIYGVA